MSAGTLLDRAPQRAVPRARAGALPRAGLALAALTGAAAIVRFAGIGHQGFWFDEGNTALLVQFSPGKMLGLIPHSESTPPLYYLLAWVWTRVFGHGEAGLRSLSALAGVATVPVAYAAARQLFSTRTALVTAALTTFNPLLIWYSQEARSYSLLVLMSSLSLLGFLRALRAPEPRALAWWALASALALATHYYAVLAVAPEAIWLLYVHRRRPAVLAAVGALAAGGLALIPLALSQDATGHANWIGTVSLERRLSQVVPDFAAGFQLPAQSFLAPLACLLAGAGLVLVAVRGDPSERRSAAVTAALALAGLILNLLLVAGGVDDLIARNVLALWLPAALTVACGLGARRTGAVGPALAAGLCAIGITGSIGVLTHRDFQRPDWRGVARLLGPAPAPGAGARAILVQHYRNLLPLSLYEPGLKFMPHRGVRVRELDVVSFTSPSSGGFCWWGTACNLWPSQMQSSYRVPGFQRVWRRRVHQFTVLRLTSPTAVLVTPRLVARALHTTSFRSDGLLVQR